MIVEPISLVFFGASAATLAFALLVMAVSYTKNAHKLMQTEDVNRHLQNQLTEKPVKLLEQAHEQAQEIIQQANRHANDILASTKTYEDSSNANIKQKLADLEKQQEEVFNNASLEMKTAYQNMLTQIQEEDITTLKAMTKDIESDILSDFKEFRGSLEKETINSEKVVKEKIDEEYLEIEKELQEYKQKKYEQVDEDIYKILYRVSEMVLSQGITFDKHKQLVLEALETAKKEQVFK